MGGVNITKPVSIPNLPAGKVTAVLISQIADKEIIHHLKQKNISVVLTPACPDLAPPVCGHPDMLAYHAGGGRLIVYRGVIQEFRSQILSAVGFALSEGSSSLGGKYPKDIAFNCARVGNFLICNQRNTDPLIVQDAGKQGLEIVSVRQGYAKCSICVVDERSIITSDASIAMAAERHGISVLKIREGYIRLTGYSYGFIGGTCGKIAPDQMCFFGNIRSHPDYGLIREFSDRRGMQLISLGSGPLTDYGSLLPLAEE